MEKTILVSDTTFEVSQLSDKGRHFQLIFKGINYRAAIWIERAADMLIQPRMAGMFAQYSLRCKQTYYQSRRRKCALLSGSTRLIIRVLPATEQLEGFRTISIANGGPTGDIGKNVTMLCSVRMGLDASCKGPEYGIMASGYIFGQREDVTICSS